MSMQVFNARRRKFETWVMKVCKCGTEFMAKPKEELCTVCDHKKMLTQIRARHEEDDWDKVPGGRVRKNHINTQDR